MKINSVWFKILIALIFSLPILLSSLYFTASNPPSSPLPLCCDIVGLFTFTLFTFVIVSGSKFPLLVKSFGLKLLLTLHRCLSALFLICFVVHLVLVFFLPYVKSFANFFATVFDFKDSLPTALGSIVCLVSLPVIFIAWLGKPTLKKGIPWKAWKIPHYFLYIAYFVIAAHGIQASTFQLKNAWGPPPPPYPGVIHLINTVYLTTLGGIATIYRCFQIVLQYLKKRKNLNLKVKKDHQPIGKNAPVSYGSYSVNADYFEMGISKENAVPLMKAGDADTDAHADSCVDVNINTSPEISLDVGSSSTGIQEGRENEGLV